MNAMMTKAGPGVAHVLVRHPPQRHALGEGDGDRDQHDVRHEVGGAAGEGQHHQRVGVGCADARAVDAEQERGNGGGERGEPVRGRVEGAAQRHAALDDLDGCGGDQRGEDGVLPAEEHLGRQEEDERQRDAPVALLVERDRLCLSGESGSREGDDADDHVGRRRRGGDPQDRPDRDRHRHRDHGDDVPEQSGRIRVGR